VVSQRIPGFLDWLFPNRWRHCGRFSDLCCAYVESGRRPRNRAGMGLLLPDQRLHNQLRVVLRRGAKREDYVGETQRRYSEVHHRIGRNDCRAADFRKGSRLVMR